MILAICLISVDAHMSILLIIKVRIFVLIKWSYGFPRSCWLLDPWWLEYFVWACSLISFKRVSLWCPFLDLNLPTFHSTCRCQYSCYFGIWHVYLNIGILCDHWCLIGHTCLSGKWQGFNQEWTLSRHVSGWIGLYAQDKWHDHSVPKC